MTVLRPARVEVALPATRPQLFVGGAWTEPATGRTMSVEDPATGEILAEVADAGSSDAEAAVAAAAGAQAAWSRTPPRQRSELLLRTHAALLEQAERFASLMTLENGKPLAEARAEVAYGAEFLRWFAEEGVRIQGRYAPAPDGRSRILTMRQAVGPSVLVTPWNFPLAMLTRKLGPALAAGCTAVVKPAPQTPLTCLLLAEVLAEAGLPPGVVNVLTTADAPAVVGTLLADARVRKLSFTGSTAVGRLLSQQASQHLLRVSMELGGNAPFVVFEDADLDHAVDQAVVAKLRNGGQSCVAANRFLIQRGIADAFTERLAERFRALTVGHGSDPDVDVGPLIDGAAVRKVGALVADAVAAGARVVVGGSPIDGPGHFFAPTVLSDVPADAAVVRDEVFGPVASITRFDDEAEALAAANDTSYGLASYLFTADLDRAIRCSEALEAGMVGLNRGLVSDPAAPFGGTKASGLGREGSHEGLDEYLEVKFVALDGRSL